MVRASLTLIVLVQFRPQARRREIVLHLQKFRRPLLWMNPTEEFEKVLLDGLAVHWNVMKYGARTNNHAAHMDVIKTSQHIQREVCVPIGCW